MRHFFSSLFAGGPAEQHSIQIINRLRGEFEDATAEKLREIAHRSKELTEVIAAVAVAAKRELGLDLFDVQLQGALALANGRIAEMQTGEGKTLTAVPAVIWLAKAGAGVHVMTVNDYLARRDARWMGAIYQRLGFSVGCIQQGMLPADRKRAYACDITYATANEIGFDYLRDQLALHPDEQVHRPFASALIDEADSILIDEARIPLVIAGGEPEEEQLAVRADRVIRRFRGGFHYTVEDRSRNVILTDIGIRAVEDSFQCGNLYAAENLTLLTAVQDALHAHALLRCDVDYIVQAGAIESGTNLKAEGLRPQMASRIAHRDRGEGGRGFEDAGPRVGLDDAAEPDLLVSLGLRDDRHGGHAGGGIPPHLLARSCRDSDEPSDDQGAVDEPGCRAANAA